MNKITEIPRKRVSFHVMRERFELEKVMPKLPADDEVVKILSNGGFSSISFIRYLADTCGINELHVSSLAVGKKHAEALNVMYQQSILKKATFVVGGIMKEMNNNKYNYFGFLKEVCKQNDWNLYIARNHSKIILFDTPVGKFVLETSSNLNQNPSIEHFSFEKNETLHDFYKKYFFSLFREGEDDEG